MPQIGLSRLADIEAADDFPQIVRVRDVLVVPSPGHRANEQDWLDNPPVEDAIDLGNGVFVERLRGDDGDLPDQVMDASSARGLNFQPVRQFGQLYSFWREVPLSEHEEQGYAWDPTHVIVEAIALSRFVLDNGHGFEFAGRVIDRSDRHRKIACTLSYDMRSAYRVRKDRFWLTREEAEDLRGLLDQYRAVRDTLPDRVKRGIWHADRAYYCPYINEAVTNIVTGLEALVNTGDDEPITSQFVKRSQALAAELDRETSRSYWTWVYDARSRAVHGAEAHLVVPAGWDETEDDPPRDVARVARAQDVLRLALRKAVEDEEFRAVFETEESIRERFPLDESRGGARAGGT
jgi:hypothetical protein